MKSSTDMNLICLEKMLILSMVYSKLQSEKHTHVVL